MVKKAFLLVLILFVSVISTACINNFAVQELNNKAKTALDSGDYDTAISRLKSSIDLDGTIFETHYNLGIAYTQAEKYPQAVETFKDAAKLRPNFADTYYSMAVAQENFAKGIIDGTIKKNEQGFYEAVKNANTTDENAESSKVKLTKEDKIAIADIFNDAITSYNTYLEKNPQGNDNENIQNKISYLQNQAHKYAPDKYEQASQNDGQTSENAQNYVQ